MLAPVLNLAQPGAEIALFAGAAFALQYVAAVAAKPFFDLGDR